jgi:hypothetical protein
MLKLSTQSSTKSCSIDPDNYRHKIWLYLVIKQQKERKITIAYRIC